VVGAGVGAAVGASVGSAVRFAAGFAVGAAVGGSSRSAGAPVGGAARGTDAANHRKREAKFRAPSDSKFLDLFCLKEKIEGPRRAHFSTAPAVPARSSGTFH
jgi:hypothetical protein